MKDNPRGHQEIDPLRGRVIPDDRVRLAVPVGMLGDLQGLVPIEHSQADERGLGNDLVAIQ